MQKISNPYPIFPIHQNKTAFILQVLLLICKRWLQFSVRKIVYTSKGLMFHSYIAKCAINLSHSLAHSLMGLILDTVCNDWMQQRRQTANGQWSHPSNQYENKIKSHEMLLSYSCIHKNKPLKKFMVFDSPHCLHPFLRKGGEDHQTLH